MNALTGIEIVASKVIPETQRVAVADADERLLAMTAHHLVLDLVPLTQEEPAIWEMTDARGRKVIACHPNVFAKIKHTLAFDTGVLS